MSVGKTLTSCLPLLLTTLAARNAAARSGDQIIDQIAALEPQLKDGHDLTRYRPLLEAMRNGNLGETQYLRQWFCTIGAGGSTPRNRVCATICNLSGQWKPAQAVPTQQTAQTQSSPSSGSEEPSQCPAISRQMRRSEVLAIAEAKFRELQSLGCSKTVLDSAEAYVQSLRERERIGREKREQSAAAERLEAVKRFEGEEPLCSGVLSTSVVPSRTAAIACAEAMVKHCAQGSSSDSEMLPILAWVLTPCAAADRFGELWVAAQSCLATTNPVQAESAVKQDAPTWKATGRYDKIAACLDACVLSDESRTALTQLEQGQGYRQRIEAILNQVEASLPSVKTMADLDQQDQELSRARDDVGKHKSELNALWLRLHGLLPHHRIHLRRRRCVRPHLDTTTRKKAGGQRDAELGEIDGALGRSLGGKRHRLVALQGDRRAFEPERVELRARTRREKAQRRRLPHHARFQRTAVRAAIGLVGAAAEERQKQANGCASCHETIVAQSQRRRPLGIVSLNGAL